MSIRCHKCDFEWAVSETPRAFLLPAEWSPAPDYLCPACEMKTLKSQIEYAMSALKRIYRHIDEDREVKAMKLLGAAYRKLAAKGFDPLAPEK